VKEGVIRQARFYGDYFGSENREEIESLLEGRVYREDALREALEGFPLERSFKGASTEEFLAFLLS
jgi:lipoate-protein ligase A